MEENKITAQESEEEMVLDSNCEIKKETNSKKSSGFSAYIKKNYSQLERKDFLFAYLLVLFPVAQFLVFWVYVNASSIALAFQNDLGGFTLNNFKTVYTAFVDKDMFGINLGESLRNSFILWIIGEGIIFPVGLITTYVLTRKIIGHYVFRLIYIIPSLMAICNAMKIKVSDLAFRNGFLKDPNTAFPTLVIIRSIMGIVGNNAVLTGAYTRVPTELFESAELDGASFGTELFAIAIPCIWSTICTLLTFALCSVFTCDYNVYLFTEGMGDNGTSTIGFQLFKLTYELSRGTVKSYGYPAALGLVLTVFTLPIVLVGKWALEKMSENVEV